MNVAAQTCASHLFLRISGPFNNSSRGYIRSIFWNMSDGKRRGPRLTECSVLLGIAVASVSTRASYPARQSLYQSSGSRRIPIGQPALASSPAAWTRSRMPGQPCSTATVVSSGVKLKATTTFGTGGMLRRLPIAMLFVRSSKKASGLLAKNGTKCLTKPVSDSRASESQS